MTMYGPSVVPNGFVDTQNVVQGRTPCRPHSLIRRDNPMITAIMLPKDAKAMRKLSPRTALLLPKTFSKNRLAVVSFEFSISSFGTVRIAISVVTLTYTRLSRTDQQQRKQCLRTCKARKPL